jgi:hypothetical protein
VHASGPEAPLVEQLAGIVEHLATAGFITAAGESID